MFEVAARPSNRLSHRLAQNVHLPYALAHTVTKPYIMGAVTTLRDIRMRAGLTQAELALRSGVRQATISAIENGRSRPHRGTLLAIAQALASPRNE